MPPDRAVIDLPYALQNRLPAEALGIEFSLTGYHVEGGGQRISTELVVGSLTIRTERSCPDRGPRRLRVVHEVQVIASEQGWERKSMVSSAPAEILAELMMAQVEAEAAACLPGSFEGLPMNPDPSVAARARDATREELIDLAESCGETIAKRLPKLARYYPECARAPRATVQLPSTHFPWAMRSYEPGSIKTFRY